MILINLLPYREARRKQRKQNFVAGIGLSVLIGALVVAGAWVLLQMLIANQRQRNEFLEGENTRLDNQIKDIANLRDEIEALTRRQNAVEALQAERNLPVHLLNEIARLTPEGVYLTSVKQQDRVVTLAGMAQTQERISEFLRNTSRDARWLLNPQLGEIKLANLSATNSRDTKRLFDFSIRVTVKGLQPAAENKGASSSDKKGG
jgi:type IV pilus assembly protein PilN